MANMCCAPLFSSQSENNEDVQTARRLLQIVKDDSYLEELDSYIEDFLKPIIFENRFSGIEVAPSKAVDDCIKFSSHLMENILMKNVNRQGCIKVRSEMRSAVIELLRGEDEKCKVVTGFSIVAYVLQQINKTSSTTTNKQKRIHLVCYMCALSKHMKQLHLDRNLPPGMLDDVVHFIAQGSLTCVIQGKSFLLCRYFPAILDSADIQSLMFELSCRHPDLSLESLMDDLKSKLKEHLYTVDQARDRLFQFLKMDISDKSTKAVVVYGEGGIGKTFLASAVFNRLKLVSYDICRVHVDHNCSDHHLKRLQQQILRDLFDKNVELQSSVDGHDQLSKTFREESCQPVFIFIDNALRGSDLAKILPENLSCLPIYSRILVTTRNLDEARILSQNPNITFLEHKVKFLSERDSKNLLRTKALGSEEETFEPDVNISKLVKLCKGIPLALLLVGSYFHQNANRVSAACSELINKMDQGQHDINNTIDTIVEFIYGSLEEDNKEALLDIACFFNNWERRVVAYIVDGTRLMALVDAGLVKISDEGKLIVHDVVLQAVLRHPNGRVADLQSWNDATRNRQELQKIRGVWLSEGEDSLEIEAGSLDSMCSSLRVLFLGKSIKVNGQCNGTFENLKFFSIHHRHCLPMDVQKLPRVAFFEGTLTKDAKYFVQLPESLHILNLSGSSELTTFAECKLPSSLELVDLSECFNLIGLPTSFCQLTSLTTLKLCSCSEITALPANFGCLSRLEKLDLTECDSLNALPPSFDLLHSLRHLHLKDCSSIIQLPENFEKLTCLEKLDLAYCDGLKGLPETFHRLPNLRHLCLTGCSSLNILPENFGNLTKLEKLDLTDCDSLGALPPSFGKLNSLCHLKLRGCSELGALPEAFVELRSLASLDLVNCTNLNSLPHGFHKLSCLKILLMDGCLKLSHLRIEFGQLKSLKYLSIAGCTALERLSDETSPFVERLWDDALPSLEAMNASGCSQLEANEIKRLAKGNTLVFLDIRESPRLIKWWKQEKNRHSLIVVWHREMLENVQNIFAETAQSSLFNSSLREYSHDGDDEGMEEASRVWESLSGKRLAVLVTMYDLSSSSNRNNEVFQFVKHHCMDLNKRGFNIIYVDLGAPLMQSKQRISQILPYLPSSTVAWIATHDKRRRLCGYSLYAMLWWGLSLFPAQRSCLAGLHTFIVGVDLVSTENQVRIENSKLLFPALEVGNTGLQDSTLLITDRDVSFKTLFCPFLHAHQCFFDAAYNECKPEEKAIANE